MANSKGRRQEQRQWFRVMAGRSEQLGRISVAVGFGLTLLIGGLPLIGISVHVWIGGIILAVAFGAFSHAFWMRFSSHPAHVRIGTIALVGLLYFSLLTIQMRSEFRREHAMNFIYVFPTAWLPTQQWAFLVVHSGTEPIFNARMMLSEMDRRYTNRALTSDEIRKTTLGVSFPEIDPTPAVGPPVGFTWTPTSPEHDEYLIQLSYRTGLVLEHLLIERVADDKWAFALRVGDPDGTRTLIECQDPSFPKGPWYRSGLRPCQTGRLPHRAD